MKIAYVIEVNPYQNSGIVKKINDQIEFWTKQGHDVKPYILWPKLKASEINYFRKGKLYYNTILNNLPDNFIKTYLTKILTLPKIQRELESFAPDILYIRQNIWYPGLPHILKKHNTVLELNSVDYLEMSFYSTIKRKIYLFGKKRILKSVKGLVAVSPDILKHYKSYSLKQVVVSNGINLDNFKPLEGEKSNDIQNVELVFVGSPNMQWHGLDKINQLANFFPEWKFHIVGYTGEDSNNITFHGWLNKDELVNVYSRCHFGIASFSNFMVGKPIDSTLKVREYLAYGLPVLSGHQDVDFLESDLVFKITDENNNLISKEDIYAHVLKNMNRTVEKKDILIIDSKEKENKRLAFFEQIMNL